MPPIQRVTFAGHEGHSLAGRVDRPAGTPRAWALFAHCFTCSKDLLGAREIAAELTKNGYGVLRFDFAGLGHSDGEFADTNFSSNIQDLQAAAQYMASDLGPPSLLVGHSLGGAAVLMAACDIQSVKAVATIGAPSSASHVKKQFAADLDTIASQGRATVTLAGRQFQIKKQFLDDIEEGKVTDYLSKLNKALLICHSPVDEIVGINNATDLFVAARHPKSFLSLNTSDHLLTDRSDARYAAHAIAAWASSYVDTTGDEQISDLPQGPNAVRVGETGRGTYHNDVVTADGHRLVTDEPSSVGGGGEGPNPYEYLNIALGSCTSMTVRMYANHKQWPLDRVEVELTHEKTHAEDCEHCEDPKAKVDVIERSITLVGDLDDAQRARLLEIADKCPVHRTLNSPVVIRTQSKEPAAN